MDRIVIRVRMLEQYSDMCIYHNKQQTNKRILNNNMMEEIITTIREYNINNIDFIGSKQFNAQLINNLKNIAITKYNITDLNITTIQ